MRTPTIAAITAAALISLAACTSSSSPDVAACKQAMTRQFDAAMKTGAKGSQPPECTGVDSKTLTRLAGEITEEQLKKAMSTATP